ncbi:MAG: tRNA (guanine37-N1)-methyltransferase [Parcubacteria group bacterium Gr01-1014_18]|nr:MAG: tRNA (guanine37-N1)-methyltransferase [Parcubacteria group bacterium Greene0416_36]TSC80203.1 MAG: tRNA (guanine37-N1)-methyltransferase [Parcubacteria group bacterium Gr01-1014_18]TSC98385.1 MAG: tRNA (guanine37-N1)-methyltransferase [Parcubacteria group bacterium Greene1014_20]
MAKNKIHFHLLTIFPEIFGSYLHTSILGRAESEGKINFDIIDIRDFTNDKHKKVDDTPYGGGAGMVMKVEPIYNCVSAIKLKIQNEKLIMNSQAQVIDDKSQVKKHQSKEKTRVIVFSAKGKQFTEGDAKRLAKYDHLVMICPRYEGVDERVVKYIADEELSIGPYVLTGGELPAMIVADAVSRLIPGVLGNKDSLREESFSKPDYLEYPQYTRPAEFTNDDASISKTKKWKVPGILLSGDHEKIRIWRAGKK